jgi:hypothetical protein
MALSSTPLSSIHTTHIHRYRNKEDAERAFSMDCMYILQGRLFVTWFDGRSAGSLFSDDE